ncbi:MAG: hypothetical protein P4L79_00175 [Legionella sp.]|uniref:hypothetical protein n=1 Tax=Legionella sp. TaxID=459 RepID=UPI00283D4E83|nr:hypothetical protein [Legionella sp.]
MELSKKIEISSDTVALNVAMSEMKIIMCSTDDDIFLFTDGMGLCVGIIAYCELKNNQKIIAVYHMSPIEFENIGAEDEYNPNVENCKVPSQYYPLNFHKFIDNIRKFTEETDIIKLYFCGGRKTVYSPFEFYCDYVRQLPYVLLMGNCFGRYTLEHMFGFDIPPDDISLTAGIHSSGRVTLAPHAHGVDDRYKDEYYLTKYCEYYGTTQPPNKLVRGFRNLTIEAYEKHSICFKKHETGCYIYQPPNKSNLNLPFFKPVKIDGTEKNISDVSAIDLSKSN